MNELSNFFLTVTEYGSEKKIRIRADQVLGYKETDPDGMDIFTPFINFRVTEDASYILASLQVAYASAEERKKK